MVPASRHRVSPHARSTLPILATLETALPGSLPPPQQCSLLPPASSCFLYLPPASSLFLLLPPASSYFLLLPPSSSCFLLFSPASCSFLQLPPASSGFAVAGKSPGWWQGEGLSPPAPASLVELSGCRGVLFPGPAHCGPGCYDHLRASPVLSGVSAVPLRGRVRGASRPALSALEAGSRHRPSSSAE